MREGRDAMCSDEEYMHEAIRLAKHAVGRTSPNPLVGAVIVKDGRIVGEGWHRKAGTPHAEVHALRMAGELAKGATLYVTLEPCSHYGRTPPCAKAVAESGISRVVIGMQDPNPLVAGKGIQILRDAGVDVRKGVCEEEARALNAPFLKWIQSGIPFIAVKMAMSLDGKIATSKGESQWITNEDSRGFGHRLRDIYDGILVGINTVIKDDPSLTSRLPNGSGRNPSRVVLDSMASIPLKSKLLNDGAADTIIAVSEMAPEDRVKAIEAKERVKVIRAGSKMVDLPILMKRLGEMEITSLLVEGGATVNDSFFREGLCDKVYAFIAPMIIGGKNALSPVGGVGFGSLSDAVRLCHMKTCDMDGDILVTADVIRTDKG